MTTHTVCPWCSTEIVWDEVLGPEEECPYCHNELQEYRSLNVPIEVDEDDMKQDAADEQDEPEEKGWSNFGWGDEAMLFASADDMKYQEGVDRVLQEQLDVPECSQCREYMMLIGRETVSQQSFEPHVREGCKTGMVQAPFQLDVYVCSSCFQVTKRLGQDERDSLKEQIRQLSESDQ
ncbi:hypothetical protein [Paenibacillus marinisediminis]